MKKYFNKKNKPFILMFSCSAIIAILLIVSACVSYDNDMKLFQKEYTIYTSAKEYTPMKIVYNVEEKKEIQQEQPKEEIIEPKEETQLKPKEEVKESKEVVEKNIVYDNMTIEELSEKLNKSLNSNVAGYGNLFATYSLEKGVDPYIAVAIMLHETGCKWTCSNLVRNCNNVGGQKGTPSCGNGSYKKFDTLEDGIKGYIDNLSNNYFTLGLNTPETIARKYTGHSGVEWVSKVNNYINDIKIK